MKLFGCGGEFHMQPAQARREQELRQLVAEGVPLRTLGKSGHWILGPLHIYTASGRWLSAATGRRGRLNDNPLRRIIEMEYGIWWPTDKKLKTIIRLATRKYDAWNDSSLTLCRNRKSPGQPHVR